MASSSDNFLVFGANVEESSLVVKKYAQYVYKQIAELEITLKICFRLFFTLSGCLSFFNFSILAICKPCRLKLTRTDTRSSGSPEPPDLGENSKVDISSSIVLIFDQCMSEQMNN